MERQNIIIGIVMKSLEINRVDDKDEEIADILISLWMSRSVAEL